MRAVVTVTAAVLVALAAGCGGGSHPQLPASASASRGKMLIEYYGCGACHVIGGISTADGHVGPPLVDFSGRYPQIVGRFPNTPRNLVRWIMNPLRYAPKGDMPVLGIGPRGALDIAAYLYSQ